jgi:hypothetical protein
MASSNGKLTHSGTVLQEMLIEATFNQINFLFIFSHFCDIKSKFSYLICSYYKIAYKLYAKVGHSKLVEMHGNTSDFYRSTSQSDWYFILTTRLKLRSIYRTVTFRQVQLKIYFELQYFIP